MTKSSRGQELVDEIAKLMQQDMQLTDYEFGCHVRRFAKAMSKNGEDYLEAGFGLAEYLISGRELGLGERRLLALMVLGELRRPAKKPALHPHHPDVLPVVERLRALQRENWSRSAAVTKTAEEFGVTEKTVRDREKIVLERENAIRKAKANLRLEE